jgi:hypothetical protein
VAFGDCGKSLARMVTPRIYADGNEMTKDDRFILDIPGSLADIRRYGGSLHPGATIVLNVQNEFEVEGVLEFDAARQIWLGHPDWATRREL